MTDRQRKFFFFPAWSHAVQANHWHMAKKRLVIPEDRLTDEGRAVLVCAQQRAINAGRGPTLDDLRHGCYILALGRDKETDHLTNDDVDRVVTLFNLLKDPDDLDARMKWDAYQRGEDPGADKRVDWFIKKAAPDAYVRAISESRFGSRQWEWLTLAQKRSLAMTLGERKKAKGQRLNSKTASAQPSALASEDPDWNV